MYPTCQRKGKWPSTMPAQVILIATYGLGHQATDRSFAGFPSIVEKAIIVYIFAVVPTSTIVVAALAALHVPSGCGICQRLGQFGLNCVDRPSVRSDDWFSLNLVPNCYFV